LWKPRVGRGHGIVSMLVRRLMEEAKRLGLTEMYLGADIPDFYTRFGAEVHEQVNDVFCVMRLKLEA